jgi:hypothetical protein
MLLPLIAWALSGAGLRYTAVATAPSCPPSLEIGSALDSGSQERDS